ncbi:hypothetical protein V8F33_011171 [Rhypophila sp. PSN 637]
MDIGSQNEGKIYLPSPGHDGKVYVSSSQGWSAPSTPAWTAATVSPPPQVASYRPPLDGSYAGNSYGYEPPAEKTGDGTICGLRRTTFILSTIIAILLLALALGLGLGLGLGRNGGQSDGQKGTSLGANESSSSPTPTTAETTPLTGTRTTMILTVSQTVTNLPTMLDLDCPSPANPSPTVKLLGPAGNPTSTFTMNCGKDNVGFDIMNTLSYSMEDCMRACAMYNHFSKQRCAGVQFWKDIAASTSKWDGNCFLKSGTASTLGDKNSRDTVWLALVEDE